MLHFDLDFLLEILVLLLNSMLLLLLAAFIYAMCKTEDNESEDDDNAAICCEIEFLSDSARVPAYKTPGAACADIYACLPADVSIAAGDVVVIPTGFKLNIPSGFEVLIRARSGLSCKNITLSNAVGTIDSDYNKEIGVILANHSSDDFIVHAGDRIAQMCIKKAIKMHFEVVEALSMVTERGGFGSTGINPGTNLTLPCDIGGPGK
jgi:dUTP pyrophosphatase